MKKRLVASFIYFITIYIIGAIVTCEEYYTTSLMVNLWFSIPMTIGFFIEISIFKRASYILIGILNTIILFIASCALGIFLLERYMYIPF